MADDLAGLRARRKQRRETKPVGAFTPSSSKQVPIDRVMLRVDMAAEKNDPAAYYAGKVPTPERITLALDSCELYGPEVDEALGGVEPMVDEWEAGKRVPILEQVQALAKLTGYPVRFFYLEAPPPLTGGFICGKDGCKPLGVTEDKGCCPRCGRSD